MFRTWNLVFKIWNLIALAVCWLMLCPLALRGQEIKPKAHFQKDSLKIGEVVPYTFSYTDRKNRPVVFPDSLYDFSPFELVSKAYYDTQSDSLHSVDSAVYYLTTFEIDKVQKLSLPVYLVAEGDSLPVFSNVDSIRLREVVLDLPDSVNLQETANYRPVSMEFNYPYLLIGLVLAGIMSLAVLLIWGKALRKKLRLYRLSKKLEKFKRGFEVEVSKLANEPAKSQIESVLKFWKNFMEELDRVPYRQLTTKEIALIHQSKSLEETLKSIDTNIYSRATTAALQNDFEYLMDYSIDHYNRMTESIKNA